MRRFNAVLVLSLGCLLSSCVVGPRYQRPVAKAPEVHRGSATADAASIADLPWWDVFQDEALRGLIKTAIANNNDLRVAAARVEQARQYLVQAHSEYLPQAGYQIGVSGGQNESLGNPISAGGRRQGTLALALGAAWEPDLWGRIRNLNEFALARYLQTEQGRRGVLLSLVSDVARSYFELLQLDLRLEVARRNARAFEDTLRLFEERLNAGKASRLETSRAQGALATTTAAIPELERRMAIQENLISILLGSLPGPVARKGTLLEQTIPPDVPAGLPSALLERRPDVLAAEANVRAANAQVGIATAAFFPTIGLTAVLGHVSSPLRDIALGRTSVFGGAATAAGPLYTGGSLRARKRELIAAWEQTRIQYEQTALAAFRDVSDALITREKLEDVRARQLEAVKAYQDAVEMAQQRYTAGRSSYFEVLDAQMQLFPAENALVQTERDRRLALVQLYQALGGGWKLGDADWNGP